MDELIISVYFFQNINISNSFRVDKNSLIHILGDANDEEDSKLRKRTVPEKNNNHSKGTENGTKVHKQAQEKVLPTEEKNNLTKKSKRSVKENSPKNTPVMKKAPPVKVFEKRTETPRAEAESTLEKDEQYSKCWILVLLSIATMTVFSIAFLTKVIFTK